MFLATSVTEYLDTIKTSFKEFVNVMNMGQTLKTIIMKTVCQRGKTCTMQYEGISTKQTCCMSLPQCQILCM